MGAVLTIYKTLCPKKVPSENLTSTACTFAHLICILLLLYLGKSKKVIFSTVLFIYTSYYLRYLRIKQIAAVALALTDPCVRLHRETGIPTSSVVRIIHRDIKLKCVKKKRAQQLIAANQVNRVERSQLIRDKFSEHDAGFIFFTDEKLFTVAAPMNSENDRVYAPLGPKKRDISARRLLRTHSTFSKSVMVSVAVSKLGCTNLIFVEPGAKINGQLVS